MSLRWTVAALAAMSFGSALAQTAPAAAPPADKNTLSYAVGFQVGADFNQRKMDVDIAQVIKGLQDGFAKRTPAVPDAQMRAALEQLQQKMLEQAKSEFERVAGENKTKSEQFLATNRTKTGIVVLPSGAQYRVIEDGTGGRPAASSEVKIHFRGSLYTGQEFASTYQGNEPVSMKVSDAPIKGLQEILPLMKAGSRWELFLPSSLAYGDGVRSPVGPNQAVVFDVKLVEVK